MREVAIVSAVRTAIGKANRGTLKDTRPDDLLAVVLRAALERGGVEAGRLDDIIVGTAMPEAEQGMNVARIGGFLAGVPDEVPAMTINRFCSSGLQSLAQGAASILAGWQDLVLTGGVESMSQIAMGGQKPSPNPRLIKDRPEAYTPMGLTAEHVAERFEVTREDQDAFALLSHDRALSAIEAGRFKEEVVPVETRVHVGGEWREVTFETDEGPRAGSSPEGLAKLRPAFKVGGTVTAATSSQLSDGAAAVLLADRQTAESEGMPILGVLRAYQVVGVPPEIMGVGPAHAIPKALDAAGLTVEDIDVFEINEAFASQALHCVRELAIPSEKVNPNGGAIALGHPLGATGARMTATLLHELKRRDARYGVVSMCIGGGMGAAAVFENVEASASRG
jgi:acetyl-CoA acyltransferase